MNGVMNKTGMREVIGRYYFATNLVYDGTVDATDQWWEDNTKVVAKTACLLFMSSKLYPCSQR